jgi:hypothetical protein
MTTKNLSAMCCCNIGTLRQKNPTMAWEPGLRTLAQFSGTGSVCFMAEDPLLETLGPSALSWTLGAPGYTLALMTFLVISPDTMKVQSLADCLNYTFFSVSLMRNISPCQLCRQQIHCYCLQVLGICKKSPQIHIFTIKFTILA